MSKKEAFFINLISGGRYLPYLAKLESRNKDYIIAYKFVVYSCCAFILFLVLAGIGYYLKIRSIPIEKRVAVYNGAIINSALNVQKPIPSFFQCFIYSIYYARCPTAFSEKAFNKILNSNNRKGNLERGPQGGFRSDSGVVPLNINSKDTEGGLWCHCVTIPTRKDGKKEYIPSQVISKIAVYYDYSPRYNRKTNFFLRLPFYPDIYCRYLQSLVVKLRDYFTLSIIRFITGNGSNLREDQISAAFIIIHLLITAITTLFTLPLIYFSLVMDIAEASILNPLSTPFQLLDVICVPLTTNIKYCSVLAVQSQIQSRESFSFRSTFIFFFVSCLILVFIFSFMTERMELREGYSRIGYTLINFIGVAGSVIIKHLYLFFISIFLNSTYIKVFSNQESFSFVQYYLTPSLPPVSRFKEKIDHDEGVQNLKKEILKGLNHDLLSNKLRALIEKHEDSLITEIYSNNIRLQKGFIEKPGANIVIEYDKDKERITPLMECSLNQFSITVVPSDLKPLKDSSFYLFDLLPGALEKEVSLSTGTKGGVILSELSIRVIYNIIVKQKKIPIGMKNLLQEILLSNPQKLVSIPSYKNDDCMEDYSQIFFQEIRPSDYEGYLKKEQEQLLEKEKARPEAISPGLITLEKKTFAIYSIFYDIILQIANPAHSSFFRDPNISSILSLRSIKGFFSLDTIKQRYHQYILQKHEENKGLTRYFIRVCREVLFYFCNFLDFILVNLRCFLSGFQKAESIILLNFTYVFFINIYSKTCFSVILKFSSITGKKETKYSFYNPLEKEYFLRMFQKKTVWQQNNTLLSPLLFINRMGSMLDTSPSFFFLIKMIGRINEIPAYVHVLYYTLRQKMKKSDYNYEAILLAKNSSLRNLSTVNTTSVLNKYNSLIGNEEELADQINKEEIEESRYMYSASTITTSLLLRFLLIMMYINAV